MRSAGLQLTKVEGKFECKRCGACCKGRDVPLTLDDIFRLSDFLNKDPDTFFAEYCIEVEKGENTIALPFLRRDEDSCCFLEDNICQVHFMKPSACVNMPSTIFGGIEHLRMKMPESCAIQNTRIENSQDNERIRRTYITAMMLTTIYYSKFGTFKFKLARPFIYRILLFKRNREQIYNIIGSRVASN